MTLTPPLPRGSAAPSTFGRSQRAGASDIFVAALAAERDRAIVGELAGRDQDFLLRALDVREAYRTLVREIVLHHFGRALRHVLEDLRLELFVRALEREQQLVGRHLAQQLLHAA